MSVISDNQRITATCDWPTCSNYSWGTTEEDFLRHTAPDGGSNVKLTRKGLWACRGHAYAMGGWA